MRRPRLTAGTIGALAFAASSLALGDSWTSEPLLTLGAEYATNPAVFSAGDSGQAAVLTGTFPLEWRSGVQRVTLEPKLRLGKSSGASPLGDDGYYLSSAYRAEWSRYSIDASAAIADDSGIIRQPEAGTLVRSPVRQRGLNEHFANSYDVTERDSVSLNADLRQQRYGVRPNGVLYDYDYGGGTARYVRLLSENHALTVSTSRTRYTLPDYGYRTDSRDLSIGLTGVVANFWQYQVNLGQSQVSTSTRPDRATGRLYTAQLDRNGELLHVVVSAVQSLQPSGFGSLVLSREYNGRLDYTASPRLRLSAVARSARVSDVFYSLALTERRFESVSAGAEWALNERWNARLDGTYQRGSIGGLFSVATSGHSVGLYLSVSRHFARFSLH